KSTSGFRGNLEICPHMGRRQGGRYYGATRFRDRRRRHPGVARMKNLIKVAFLSSIITAALVYVVVEWRPLQSESPRAPEVSLASTKTSATSPVPAAAPLSDEERNNIDIYEKYSQGVVNITTTTVGYDFFLRPVPMESGTGSGAIIDNKGD